MVMLACASVVVICCGIVCHTDTDFAWQVYEWDCRLSNMAPARLRNWRLRVQQVGTGLIGLGVVGLMVSLGL